MKFSPTVTLAFALAAGIAGAAIAQTSQNPGAAAPAMPQSAAPGYPQPQANSAQTPPAGGQREPNVAQQGAIPPANPNAAMPPGSTQAVAGADPQVQRAQAQLHAAGLYNGPQDGVMDPDTRMAIANFQDQHGLSRTETLDQQTLAALTSGQTSAYGSSAPPASAAAPVGTQGIAPAPTGAGGNTNPASPPRY